MVLFWFTVNKLFIAMNPTRPYAPTENPRFVPLSKRPLKNVFKSNFSLKSFSNLSFVSTRLYDSKST